MIDENHYWVKIMANKNVLTIRIPADLKQRIARIAEEQGVSINQLAMYMFAREVGRIEASQDISSYLQGFDKKDILAGFDEIMAKVQERACAGLG